MLWNIGLTVASGLLLYLALSADFVRLGLSLLLRRSSAAWLLLYAFVAAAATQVPRIALELSSGLRNGRTVDEIVERIVGGLAIGGLNIIVGLGLLLACVGYLTAANLAAFGLERPRWAALWMQVCALLIVLAVFTVLSLPDISFQAPVLVIVGAIAILALAPPLLARCTECQRSAAPGLWLATCCACGHDRVGDLRTISLPGR